MVVAEPGQPTALHIGDACAPWSRRSTTVAQRCRRRKAMRIFYAGVAFRVSMPPPPGLGRENLSANMDHLSSSGWITATICAQASDSCPTISTNVDKDVPSVATLHLDDACSPSVHHMETA